jgi:hypothetical protein
MSNQAAPDSDTSPAAGVTSPARIALNLDRLGLGTIIVNGIDLSAIVRSTRLYSRAGQITAVDLEIPAALLTVEAEAALKIYLVKDQPAPEEPS